MIGVNSITMPGVEIGPNAIIGAGSVVTKTVPKGTVFTGNPAKFICSVEEYFNKIKDDIFLIEKSNDLKFRKKEI